MITSPPRKTYSIRFLLTLGLLMLLPLVAAMRMYDFRQDAALDMEQLKPGEAFVSMGATQRQRGQVKIGHLERAQTLPLVGAFGPHQIFNMAAEDIGLDAESFFNGTATTNPNLPEIRDYLYHLKTLGKLPSELVIVHLFTPANKWGRQYIEYNGANPLDVSWGAAGLNESWTDWLSFSANMADTAMQKLKEIFNYQNVLIGLLADGGGFQVMNIDACVAGFEQAASRPPAALWVLTKIVPTSILVRLGVLNTKDYCSFRTLHGMLDYSIFRDGRQFYAPFYLEPPKPFQDADTKNRLQFGDDKKMARYLDQIYRIVTDGSDRKIVFYIPPVYRAEEPYRRKIVDQIMDAALERMPRLPVIDHRSLNLSAEMFVDRMHMTSAYFEILAKELRQKGLLSSVRNEQG